ncbi:MAG: putative bifunctional diguanylate cyclase/phosphodiesterase [Microthrixaceae bacterium]
MGTGHPRRFPARGYRRVVRDGPSGAEPGPPGARSERDELDAVWALLDTTDEAMFFVAQDGTIVLCNRAAEEHFARAGAAVGDPLYSIDADRLGPLAAAFGRALAVAAPVRIEYTVASDGTGPDRWREAVVTPRLDAMGLGGGVAVLDRDVTDRRRLEERTRREAAEDSLTGLANRRGVLPLLRDELARLRPGAGLGVLYLDLDHFKDVNDSRGHDVGDLLLKAVAERLTDATRACDRIARMGGDEFVVILPGVDASEACRAAERFLGEVRRPFDLDVADVTISASIGVAVTTDRAADPADLVRDADLAMYQAKELDRDDYHLFDAHLRARVIRRFEVEQELRSALADGALEPWFQPQVDLVTGRIDGVEVLARWVLPDGTVREAGDFIAVAERSGLIVDVGWQMLVGTCAALGAWRAAGLDVPRVWINASPKELARHGMAGRILEELARHGVTPDSIGVEVTETAILFDRGATPDSLAELSAAGVALALDDFGTGFSSMANLQRLHVDTLKIDRSFVSTLSGVIGGGDLAIVAGTVALGAALGAHVVAEGVETHVQADVLAQLGCPTGQGYHFSRPVPAEEMARILAGGDDLPE